jgi:hypothetical protein
MQERPGQEQQLAQRAVVVGGELRAPVERGYRDGLAILRQVRLQHASSERLDDRVRRLAERVASRCRGGTLDERTDVHQRRGQTEAGQCARSSKQPPTGAVDLRRTCTVLLGDR